jgi:hypothetical protein
MARETGMQAAGSRGKPAEAPLVDEVLEQDGSEDPGVGIELNRDAELAAARKARSGTDLPSPSAAEHVNTRGGLKVTGARAGRDKDSATTLGVGEGATVSHRQK